MVEDDRDRIGELPVGRALAPDEAGPGPEGEESPKSARRRPGSRGARAAEPAVRSEKVRAARHGTGAEPAPEGRGSSDAARRIATLAAAATVGAALAALGMAAVQAVKIARARGPRKVIRLLPFGIGWQVKIDGAERASSLHEHRAEAVAAARDLAHRTAPAELVLHDHDGTPEGKILYRAGRWAEWI